MKLSDGTRVLGEYPLPEGRSVVGRDPRCDICLPPSEFVSRRHCILDHHQGHVSIRDISRNGTWLDGGRLGADAVPLEIGSVLGIGVDQLILCESADDERRAPTRREIPLSSPPSAPVRTAAPVRTTAPGRLVARAPAMAPVVDLIRRVAPRALPVLVHGESGVGKEEVALALHEQSGRPGAFVPINVATLGPQLFAPELFGYEKGAFTGAEARRDGAFQTAHQGTLFLDELGELDLDLQSQLLRVLQTGEVRRVGSATTERPDTRVVLATNRDLKAMVAEGRFRHDLYQRISVLPISIPPLRERMSDLPELVEQLLGTLDRTLTVAPEAFPRLLAHDWPGNVRELSNVLIRASLFADHGRIEPCHIDLGTGPCTPLDEGERIRQVFLEQGSKVRQTADVLHMPVSTLHYKLRKLGLVPPKGR